MANLPRHTYQVHLLDRFGRCFIFSTDATSPDHALDRLMASGDYIPERNDRVLKIVRGIRLLRVQRES